MTAAPPALSPTVDMIVLGKRKHSHSPSLVTNVSLTHCLFRMAMNEMRLALAKLFWNFDISLYRSSEDWWITQKSYLVWEKKPLMVSIKPRH
jgi:hypothetical protein